MSYVDRNQSEEDMNEFFIGLDDKSNVIPKQVLAPEMQLFLNLSNQTVQHMLDSIARHCGFAFKSRWK